MNGGDCPMALVYQKNREAVSRFHGDKTAWRVGQYGIAIAQTPGAIGINHKVGMDLMQGSQRFRGIEGPGAEAVFQPIEPGQSTGAVSVLEKLEIQVRPGSEPVRS